MQQSVRSIEEAGRVRIGRRSVLLGGLSLACAGVLAPTGLATALAPARGGQARDRRRLVLLQLSGGNDGLATIVPYGDDAYGRARRRTRIPDKELLRLDGYRGLHPNLRAMRALYDEGTLAIVEGVGYPGPGRSHFKAMDIWHAASEDGRVGGEGWIGRLANVAWPDSRSPELLVHVGAKTPYSLYSSSRSAVAFEVPEAYRWFGDQASERAYAESSRAREAGGSATAERLREVLRGARASSDRVRAAVAAHRPRVPYPDDELGAGLRVIAALLESNIDARVFSVELDGFDTHNVQRGTHDRLMRTLDACLGAFFRDLRGREVEKDVLVMAYSEFGRRVEENGSFGTDHGKAGPMFLAGSGVQGGLFGRHPSLDTLDEGDLVHTTDFRSVYAGVIEDWFGAPSQAVLGAEHARLPFIRLA